MALFGKNPNEVAYTGGKKNWADVIKNTGPGEPTSSESWCGVTVNRHELDLVPDHLS